MYLLGYNMSIAVWVGIIAVAGLAAQTGVVMIIYLDNAYEKRIKEGRMNNWNDLAQAIDEGAVQRVRPKMMTVMTMTLGLLPLLWSHGAGADVMKRIAAYDWRACNINYSYTSYNPCNIRHMEREGFATT